MLFFLIDIYILGFDIIPDFVGWMSMLGAVELLIPGAADWVNILRVIGLYGIGLLAALWPRNTITQMDRFRPTLWRGAVLVIGLTWSILSFTGITTFIYSNF